MHKKNHKISKSRIVCIILLGILYIGIFAFSAQNAEKSSGVSMHISKIGATIWDRFFGKFFADGSVESWAQFFEHPIRKMAHFLEYMTMGILWGCVMKDLFHGKARKLREMLLCEALVFVSAFLDEFHQYFVPGRYASMKDVLLDSAGGLTGLLILLIFGSLHRKIRQSKARRIRKKTPNENREET